MAIIDPTIQALKARKQASAPPSKDHDAHLAKIGTDSQKLNADVAKGDKKAIREDLKTLSEDYRNAARDGFTKKELRAVKDQHHGELLGARVAKHIKMGGKPDDKQTHSFINNAYSKYCMTHGIQHGQKNDGAKKAFAEDVSAGMKQQGMSQEDIMKALSTSSGMKIRPGSGGRV